MASGAPHHNRETPHMDTKEKYPTLFPEVDRDSDRKAFPRVGGDIDPKEVAAVVLKDKVGDRSTPIALRVQSFFRKVRDFDRDDDGNAIFNSLRGADKLAAVEQHVREKYVAIAEMRMVKEELKQCYAREGVDAKEHCKHLAEAYERIIETPNFNMERHGTRY